MPHPLGAEEELRRSALLGLVSRFYSFDAIHCHGMGAARHPRRMS